MTFMEIIEAVLDFTDGEPGAGVWYVGITEDCDRRLGEHLATAVRSKCFEAKDSEEARRAEKELHSLGFEGSAGGGDDNSIIVYVYNITPDTQQ